LLEKEGHQVEFANDGVDGVSQARLQLPDLILMDLRMPAPGDGFEAIKILRSDPITAEIPIFAISAWPTHQYRAHAFKAGADLFINKPIIAENLKAKIKTYVTADRKELKRLRVEMQARLLDQEKRRATD
ncbi:MAG: PleD family two-component system response regulator, partial [Anaerolineae bacterium]